jgi:hypothetical protein
MLGSLDQRTTELASAYTQSTEALRGVIDEGAERAVATLVATNERLRGELTGVLDRLQGLNRLLQQDVASASGDLGAVEEGLAHRAQQLEGLLAEVANQTGRASEQIADQVEALRSASTGAMQQASDLAHALGEQSRSLAENTQEQLRALTEAAAALERVESQVAGALNQRQDALEGLLGRIGERSQELESVTRSFTVLVEGSLQNAETKARRIGSVLADTAESANRAIGEQFDRIRSSTGEESERTAAALRTAYEEAAGEMTKALGEATARFRDTMGELRSMTAQIQRELDATRSELRRGIVEIPQETQETTANMRRVVADQIKALNELASLVSRSNRVVDAAPSVPLRRVNEPSPAAAALAPEPRPAAPAAAAQNLGPRSSPAGAATPGSQPESRSMTAAQPAAARFIEPTRAPQPKFQGTDTSPLPVPPARPVQPAPERHTGRREDGPAPREAGTRGGWLSDLLHRASRDDEPVETARSGPQRPDRLHAKGLESLDSISVDIARMIDHDAAVELWDRHKSGERNLATRRLYTSQGQQTFEEIRRRYRRDQEFKQTVDRYVEEFERLLGEVSRDDRDSKLRTSYLTSETGKVYTMLAHAAGRFD